MRNARALQPAGDWKETPMPLPEDAPIHDFPDRMIGQLQSVPEHVRELIEAVAPALAARLNFKKLRQLPTKGLLPNWHKMESDLLFEVPLKHGKKTVLVCVLIEHQSKADPAIPLRTLLYAGVYWERQWRAWVGKHAEGAPLRLNPVLPVVLHTGERRWHTHRTLAELFEGPEELVNLQPVWAPLLWDVAEHDVAELLGQPGRWFRALAVVRAEKESPDAFHDVMMEVIQRLAPLRKEQKPTWEELMNFVLSWGVRRRPEEEAQRLYHEGIQGLDDVALTEEIRQMTEKLGRTWEQAVYERGERGGELKALREVLRTMLADKFGKLPKKVLKDIDQADQVDRLKAALRRVASLESLDDFEL